VKLVTDRFGDQANVVFGWIFAGHQLGAAFMAFTAGFSRTVYETYVPAFLLSGLLCLIAALAIIAVRERPHAVAAGG
jgi:hypothetical protein